MLRSHPRDSLRSAAALLLLAAASCSDQHSTLVVPDAPSAGAPRWARPHELTLSPSTITALVGDTARLTATVTNRRGWELDPSITSWWSSDPRIASVSEDGLVTAVQAGTTTIHASADEAADSAHVTVTAPEATSLLVGECASASPAWIWCDDFEANRLASYFEVHDAGGDFTRVSGVGQGGSYGMRSTYVAGASQAGNLKLAFGASPNPGYITPVDGGSLKFRDVYWRMYVRTQAGWSGHGAEKLSRAMVFATSTWGQAAIGHVWTPGGGADPRLLIDPARGTDASGNLLATVYNDFPNLTFLGSAQGSTQLFSAANADTWYCVEAHMRLNDAGLSNGVLEFWVDGNLEARRGSLNWLGAYGAYGINAIFFENYWDSGSPVTQSRYFDNMVVSTERIGCSGGTPGGTNPVAVVEITGETSVVAGGMLHLSASQKDKTNTTVSGTLAWASSNPLVATVDGSGLVTGVAAGTTTITAESANGKRGSVVVTVIAATVEPPAITTTSLPGGVVGMSYSHGLAASGGDGSYAWAVTAGSLIAGLTLSPSTGVLAGTPTAAGTSQFTVEVTSGGQSDTQTLSVAVAPSSGVTPLLVEDFSTYSSAADLLADPRGIWNNVEGKATSQVALDATVGYGSSDRSMRYDWPHMGAVCRDHTIRPGVLQIPGNQTHVWIEYVVRFSPNFDVEHGASGCAAEYKLAAMGHLGGSGRWNVPEMQGHRWVLGWPGGTVYPADAGAAPSQLWDGEPHLFRIEAKLGPSGVFRFWVDGVLVSERTGFSTSGSHDVINYFAPGLNMNQGPAISGMKTWWHRIAVYDQNPGW